MLHVFPDYYKQFKCIAGKCKHSCCIGWEIDIDETTAERYKSITGEIGKRLRENISWEEMPHFLLGEGERCPFLNKNNLCDIILTCGEDALCGICSDHPRFRNELPGRIETGVGLCCEAAAELILGKQEPMKLVVSGEKEICDEITDKRDEILKIITNREKSLRLCFEDVLEYTNSCISYDIEFWIDFLISLERLDDAWTVILQNARHTWKQVDYVKFDEYMKDRICEYEQMAVYLVYRHFANASDELDMAARAAFAVFGCMMLYVLGACSFHADKSFGFDKQIDIARMFSSEIEYSEENKDAILSELEEYIMKK